MNDFSPVALTLAVAKCYERLLCNQQTTAVAIRLDPLQFAYRAGEDAALTTPLSSKDQSYFSSVKKTNNNNNNNNIDNNNKTVIIPQGAVLLWTRRNVSTVSKIVGSKQLHLSQLYQVSVKKNTRHIVNNTTHLLNVYFQRLPSSKTSR